MTDTISCPACRKMLQIPQEALSGPVRCPACGDVFHPPRRPSSAEAVQADPPIARSAPDAGPGPWGDLRDDQGPSVVRLANPLPGGTVGVTLIVLLVAHTVLDLLTSLLVFLVDEPRARDNQDLISVVQCLPVLFLLPTVILFCLWMYRSYQNLLDLGVQGLSYSPGWAAGSFFIPILNLFRPHQIAQEMWRASAPDVPADSPRAWRRQGGSFVILAWWLSWIVGNLANNVVFRASLSEEPHPDLPAIGLFAATCSALAALFACWMIVRLRDRQERKRKALLAQEEV